MYVEDPLNEITMYIHSFFIGALSIFTYVVTPANSEARMGAWVDALRFGYVCTSGISS